MRTRLEGTGGDSFRNKLYVMSLCCCKGGKGKSLENARGGKCVAVGCAYTRIHPLRPYRLHHTPHLSGLLPPFLCGFLCWLLPCAGSGSGCQAGKYPAPNGDERRVRSFSGTCFRDVNLRAVVKFRTRRALGVCNGASELLTMLPNKCPNRSRFCCVANANSDRCFASHVMFWRGQ